MPDAEIDVDTLRRPVRDDRLMNRLIHKVPDTPTCEDARASAISLGA